MTKQQSSKIKRIRIIQWSVTIAMIIAASIVAVTMTDLSFALRFQILGSSIVLAISLGVSEREHKKRNTKLSDN